MTRFTVTLQPERPALLALPHPQTSLVLVRVQAPAAPESSATRQPLNLSLVIDRSGSMGGAPLEEAKRCVQDIIRGLNPTDRLAVVSFDADVRVEVPHQAVGEDRTAILRAVERIRSGGSTALFDGWHAGVGQCLGGADGRALSRVLLLSDGQANHGLTDTAEIAARVAKMAEAGITTSTCGLGHGFNEDLMVRMAQAGRGNQYYGVSAADLADPFRQEFDLLRALHARRLRLKLQAPAGIGVEVLNGYSGDAATGTWLLPDLPYGGEVWALVRLTIPANRVPALEAPAGLMLEATVDAADSEGQPMPPQGAALSLPALPAAAFEVLAPDALVRARAAELRAADLQERAERAARQRNWDEVDRLVVKMKREAGDNEWLRGVAERMERLARERHEESMAKEARYSAVRMRERVAAVNESANAWTDQEENAKAAFLRRKLEQGRRFDSPDGK